MKPWEGAVRTTLLLDRHLFISYKRQDFSRALQLCEALRRCGFVVWWDQDLQTGQRWDERLDHALNAAEAVITLWSPLAVESDWVKHEASVAKAQEKLTHAYLSDCELPGAFRSIHACDLKLWSGSEDDPRFQSLIEAIKDLRRRRLWRLLVKVMSVMAVCVLAAVGGYLASRLQGTADAQAGVDPFATVPSVPSASDSELQASLAPLKAMAPGTVRDDAILTFARDALRQYKFDRVLWAARGVTSTEIRDRIYESLSCHFIELSSRKEDALAAAGAITDSKARSQALRHIVEHLAIKPGEGSNDSSCQLP